MKIQKNNSILDKIKNFYIDNIDSYNEEQLLDTIINILFLKFLSSIDVINKSNLNPTDDFYNTKYLKILKSLSGIEQYSNIPNIGLDFIEFLGLNIPDTFFFSEKGIITIISEYEFTPDYNEVDKINPEVIGKIFENLLSVFNPETKTTARKSTASFYTPREIVDYMSKQSLCEYLKTNLSSISPEKIDDFIKNENPNFFTEDEKISIISTLMSCKILDPACGSGAFPVGILNIMTNYILILDNTSNKIFKNVLILKYKELSKILEQHSLIYAIKYFLLTNCIYGVDIQKIAVKISTFIFNILLLSEEKNTKNWGILPDYLHFRVGNSLLGGDFKKEELNTNNKNNSHIEYASIF